MKKQKMGGGIVVVAAMALFFQSCATLSDLASALTNLKRLQFKLGDVTDFRLAGIDISGKLKLSQFSVLEALTLVRAFGSKSLPAEFILNVQAVNPNDGTGGSPQTVSTLTSLASRLLIDGKPTVEGNIDRPVEIPGTGQATVIPIRLSIDLFEFFGDKHYEDLINLALAIGGSERNTSRLALDAQPSVSTPYGNIPYPGRITIIDKEFR